MRLSILLFGCLFLIHCQKSNEKGFEDIINAQLSSQDLVAQVQEQVEAPTQVQEQVEVPTQVQEQVEAPTQPQIQEQAQVQPIQPVQHVQYNNVLKPFQWNYDVEAKDGILSLTGVGYIKLEKSQEPGYWIVKSETKGRAFKVKKYQGVEITLLQEDPVQYFKPLKNVEEATLSKRKETTYSAPSQNYPYYDFLSAIVFFTTDLQVNPYKREWYLWMADENQLKTFVHESDETLQTKLGPKNCYVIRKVNSSERESQLKAWISKDDFTVVKMIWTKKKKVIEINIK